MNKVFLVGGGLALLVVAVLGMTFPRSGGTVVEQLGSGVSYEADPLIVVGGVRTEFRSQLALNQATNTAAALRSPLDATSTLQFAGCTFARVGTTSTAALVTLARSTSPNASTTLLGATTVTQNAQEIVNATSTTVGNYVFSPGQYLTVTVKGESDRAYPVGSCGAEFRVN